MSMDATRADALSRETVAGQRKSAGLTQVEVARRARCALRTYMTLERGGFVNARTICRVAPVVNRTPGEVLDAALKARVMRRLDNFKPHRRLDGGNK